MIIWLAAVAMISHTRNDPLLHVDGRTCLRTDHVCERIHEQATRAERLPAWLRSRCADASLSVRGDHLPIEERDTLEGDRCRRTLQTDDVRPPCRAPVAMIDRVTMIAAVTSDLLQVSLEESIEGHGDECHTDDNGAPKEP